MSNILSRIAISLTVATLPAAAAADVHRQVTGVFDDGTALTGTFDIDSYGYLGASALTTMAQGPFTGFTYTLGDSSASNTATSIDFQPGYTSDLHLVFSPSLYTSVWHSTVSGYECVGSYSCYAASGPNVRMLVSGVATIVPEPASWALLVAGFALSGGMLRARRRLA